MHNSSPERSKSSKDTLAEAVLQLAKCPSSTHCKKGGDSIGENEARKREELATAALEAARPPSRRRPLFPRHSDMWWTQGAALYKLLP